MCIVFILRNRKTAKGLELLHPTWNTRSCLLAFVTPSLSPVIYWPCVQRRFFFCSLLSLFLPTCTIYLPSPSPATCVFLGCYGNNEEKTGISEENCNQIHILCISFWYHDHRWFTRTHIHTHTCRLKWRPQNPPLSLYIVCTLQSFHTFDWSEKKTNCDF